MVSSFIFLLDNSLIYLAMQAGLNTVADQRAEATKSLCCDENRTEFAWSLQRKFSVH